MSNKLCSQNFVLAAQNS